MSIKPKELRPEQTKEIEARSAWPVRTYSVEGQRQAEEDVRALLGHVAALHKINCLANDRIVSLTQDKDALNKIIDAKRSFELTPVCIQCNQKLRQQLMGTWVCDRCP